MEIKVALSTGDQSACVMDASGKMLCFGALGIIKVG